MKHFTKQFQYFIFLKSGVLAGEIDPSVFIDSSLHLSIFDDESFQEFWANKKGEGGQRGPSR